MASNSTTGTGKEIKYDRITRDYAAYLDGNLIGYFPNYHAAEIALDQYTFDALTHQQAA